MMPTAYFHWNGPYCATCGSMYLGDHHCIRANAQPVAPDVRLSDETIDRIARRVVELMAAKRMSEQ